MCNSILCTGSLNSFWRHVLFTMVPTTADLQQIKTWRPIAMVKITYIIFAEMLHDCLQHFYVGGRKAKQNIQVAQNLTKIKQCTPKYFHTDVSAPRYDSGRENVARQCFHSWSRKVFKDDLIHSGHGAGGYHDEENWTLGIMASHPPHHFTFAGRQNCQ